MATHPHRTIDSGAAAAFLGAGRLAIVGASDEPGCFGRTVYEALREHGVPVVPVHRRADAVLGDTCHPDLASVPGDIDGVIVMVGGDAAEAVVRDAAARGVGRVWLFRGAGPGAATPGALAAAQELGLDVVPGACPLMFLDPVGGVHRLHRGIRRLRGHLVTA